MLKREKMILTENADVLLADKTSPTLRPLADMITALLLKYPGCRVAQFAFADIFLREYGQVLKPKDWGCNGMNALIRALGDIVEVRQSSWLLCSRISLRLP